MTTMSVVIVNMMCGSCDVFVDKLTQNRDMYADRAPKT